MQNNLDLIIESCKKKNSAAFEKLYNMYVPKMKGIAYRYVNDDAIAEDILHDSFIKLFEKLSQLKDNAVFEAWLKRIVINESIDYLKKEKKLNQVIEESKQFFDNSTSDHKNMYANITQHELLNALNTLPTGYKTVFNLYVIDGFGHKEISEKLGITEGTSKSQLSKAKNFLKKQLEHKLLINE